ncbi:hypothetical protein ZIOFF_041129 [Zingiber officinale]|uniref:C3H1-type domain-containing protein n=1 Tax=Zingiber officinale TaxID=94328 RepID=A0A8J5FY42_ZINOF|nr:hypothetical protein ZIOFF_045181 [Zingiber officinale]KAG6501251.1 hypothetical protein ZIOFF_041129 [Zingiber officinale]
MMMVGGETGDLLAAAGIQPWSSHLDDPSAGVGYRLAVAGGSGDYSLGESALAAALQEYLPSNEFAEEEEEEDAALAVYSSDEFRMYEFKVRRCARGRSHDWTECPFAHPGEKARRRDPRKYHYSGSACPDFRKGGCKRGDSCEFAHGVFECWLHPARYRTQPCKDGIACRRRVCFFAHTPGQLRVLPQQQQQQPTTPGRSPLSTVESYDGSPLRQQALESYISKHLISSSPTSTLPLSPSSDSPPMSPNTAAFRISSRPVGSSINEIVASLRQFQLSKANAFPTSWGLQAGNSSFPSPRSKVSFCSLPATPTAVPGGVGWFDGVDGVGFAAEYEEEGPVERVESGRALRAKIFEKLSKECVMERTDVVSVAASSPTADGCRSW